MMKDKIYSAIMGLAVGDALGVPYEFLERDTFEATDMTGYGTHHQPAGTWSDDTSMTLATVESLARNKKIWPRDIMWNFVSWLKKGEFTAHGEVFDIGNTTHSAIVSYLNGSRLEDCGATGFASNGNGALMRILPLAFVPHSINDRYDVAGLTHKHYISCYACEIYLEVALGLLAGYKKSDAIQSVLDVMWCEEFKRISYLEDLQRHEIKSTGYVVDTLEAALWCLFKTDSYKDCVLTAVNLGDDTDTVAAVAGGLAGILYGVGGEKGIPSDWIEQIVRHDEIQGLCESFAESVEKWGEC